MRPTVKVDLTSQTKQWNRIQLASAAALFLSLDLVASVIFDISKSAYVAGPFDYESLAFQIPAAVLGLFMIRQTWRHGSVFSTHSLKMLRAAFGIAALCVLALFGYLVSIVAGASSLQEADVRQIMFGMAGFFVIITASIIVIVAITWLSYSKIRTIDRRVNALLDDAAAKANEPPPEAYWHIRIDQPAGLLLVVLGVVVFFAGSALGSLIWEYWATELKSQGNVGQMMQLSTLVEIAGALLVLKGRAYFTPKTEAVLAIDKRSPILYLRSFQDETPDTVQWGGMYSAFVDRSLEMKVAKYFLPFGPLVAIGSPQDAVPKLGAMRLIRSDAEWQGEVMALMERSRLILASVGNSEWIKWELAESFRRGLEYKTLFIFPVTIRRGWRLRKKRAAQQAERINALKALYPATECPDYSLLKKNEFLLAQVTTGARTILLTSRKPGSNSQVLSIVVGDYLLGMDQPAAAATPALEVRQRASFQDALSASGQQAAQHGR